MPTENTFVERERSAARPPMAEDTRLARGSSSDASPLFPVSDHLLYLRRTRKGTVSIWNFYLLRITTSLWGLNMSHFKTQKPLSGASTSNLDSTD